MISYGRMLVGVILAAMCISSAMLGYIHEPIPGIRMLSGEMALLLGCSSVGCIILFITAHKAK